MILTTPTKDFPNAASSADTRQIVETLKSSPSATFVMIMPAEEVTGEEIPSTTTVTVTAMPTNPQMRVVGSRRNYVTKSYFT